VARAADASRAERPETAGPPSDDRGRVGRRPCRVAAPASSRTQTATPTRAGADRRTSSEHSTSCRARVTAKAARRSTAIFCGPPRTTTSSRISRRSHTAPAPGAGPDADDELTTVVRYLSDKIEALQADVGRSGGPGLPASDPAGAASDAAQPTPPSSLGSARSGRPSAAAALSRALHSSALPAGGGRHSRGDRELECRSRSPG